MIPPLWKYVTDPFASSADFFLSVGLGLGRTDTPLVTQRKSMSTERTFTPTKDEASIHQKLGNRQKILTQGFLFPQS